MFCTYNLFKGLLMLSVFSFVILVKIETWVFDASVNKYISRIFKRQTQPPDLYLHKRLNRPFYLAFSGTYSKSLGHISLVLTLLENELLKGALWKFRLTLKNHLKVNGYFQIVTECLKYKCFGKSRWLPHKQNIEYVFKN